jgi:hypothetical protein
MYSSRLPIVAALLIATALPVAAQTISAPSYVAGDAWTYNEINAYNGVKRATVVREVIAGGPEAHIVTRSDHSAQVDDARLAAGTLREGLLNDRSPGRLEPGIDLRPFPLAEGQRWKQSATRADPVWKESRPVTVYGRVRGWETVRVPAGEFKAIKIEREMYLGDWDMFRAETRRTEYEWYVPELKMPVKLQVWEEYREPRYRVVGSMQQGDRYILELASFKRGG